MFAALRPYLDGDVVDAGANVGGLTFRFAEHAPRVIAFEPNDQMYTCLATNVLRLGLERVVIPIHRGIYSFETHISPDVTGYPASSWTWPTSAGGTGAGPADWPRSKRRVSAVKVDCQGADLHVLRGLARFIERDRPVIVFEYEKDMSDVHGDSWEDYLAWAEANRYRMTPVFPGARDFLCEPQ